MIPLSSIAFLLVWIKMICYIAEIMHIQTSIMGWTLSPQTLVFCSGNRWDLVKVGDEQSLCDLNPAGCIKDNVENQKQSK